MRLILALILALPCLAFAKYRVCTATINSSQEMETFHKLLGDKDFEFDELTDHGNGSLGPDGWFDTACDEGVACDVLVVSGHFGGNFFGSRKLTLKLEDMNKNSCQRSCLGILQRPKEVYLFGCNTLAGKNTEHRTREQYLQTLLDHGMNLQDAERNTAAIFSPFGSTFRERIEAIFEGVPRIYGFSAIAPSGASVRSSLQVYLKRLGDFKSHLDTLDANSKPAVWLESMRRFNVAYTRGVRAEDNDYSIKRNTCKIEDEKLRLLERTSLAFELLKENPNLYLPSVSRFVNESFGDLNKSAKDAADRSGVEALLAGVVGDESLHQAFLSALATKGLGDSIRVDFLTSLITLGWMSKAEYEARLTSIFSSHAAKADVDDSDFICSEVQETPEFSQYISIETIRGYDFREPGQFKIAGCMKIDDPATGERAMNAFYENHARFRAGDLDTARAWLKTFPGYNEARADAVKPINRRLNVRRLVRRRAVSVRHLVRRPAPYRRRR